MNYKNKYLKYKNKYLKLTIYGGSEHSNNLDNFLKLVRNNGIANKDKKLNSEESIAYNLLTQEEKNIYDNMSLSQIYKEYDDDAETKKKDKYDKFRISFKPQHNLISPKVLPEVPPKVPSEISSEIQKIIPSKINTQLLLSEFEIPNDTDFLSYIQCYHNITIKSKYNICHHFYVWCKEKYKAYDTLPYKFNSYITYLLHIKNNETSQYHYNNFSTYLSDHVPVVYFENNTIYFSFNVQTDDFGKFDSTKGFLYDTHEKIKFYYYIKALNICELILTHIKITKKKYNQLYTKNQKEVPYQIIITLQECMCPLYKILANILPIILNVSIMHNSFVFQNIEKQDYICSTYNNCTTYTILEHYKNEDIIDDNGFLRDSNYYVDVDGGFANFTTYTHCDSVKPMFLFDKDVNPTRHNKTIYHTYEQLKGTLIRSCRSCIFTIRTNDKTITVINVHLSKTFAKDDLIMMIDNKAQYNLEKQHAKIHDSTLISYYNNFTTTYNDIIDRKSVLVIMGDYNMTYDENILVKYNILYKLHSTTLNLDWILYFEPINELDQHEEITTDQITTDQITTDQIITDQITTDQITTDQITTDQITTEENKKRNRNTSSKKQLKKITPIIELNIQNIKDKLTQINLVKSELKKKQKELIKVKTNHNNKLKALQIIQNKIPYRILSNTLYDNFTKIYNFLYNKCKKDMDILIEKLKTPDRYKNNEEYIGTKDRLKHYKMQYDAYNQIYEDANKNLTKLRDEEITVKQNITQLEDLKSITNIEIETLEKELTNHLSQLIQLKEELMEKLKPMKNINTKKYTNSLIIFKLNIKLNNIKEEKLQLEKELSELLDTKNTTLEQSRKDKVTLSKATSAFSRILLKYKDIPEESQKILNQYKDAIEKGNIQDIQKELIVRGYTADLIHHLYTFATSFDYKRDLRICKDDDNINTTKINELDNRIMKLLSLHHKLYTQLQLIQENLENKTMNTEDLRDDETMNIEDIILDDETMNIEDIILDDIILDDETINKEDIIQADKDN